MERTYNTNLEFSLNLLFFLGTQHEEGWTSQIFKFQIKLLMSSLNIFVLDIFLDISL